jgi:N-acetylgalactosamine-6-sulfatase
MNTFETLKKTIELDPFHCISLLVISLSLLAFCSASHAAEQPNIVFILADDMGCGDFGAAGHPYAVTPNIDRLASEGTMFERFYATGVTCCPSRTGFMTSHHPASYGKYMSSFGFQDRTTVMELLKQKGYQIGHYGKWHIGGKPTDITGIYGIDEGQVIGNSDTSEDGRDGDLYDASVEFIRRNKDRPFYLNIWGHISHYSVPSDTFTEAVPPFFVDPKTFNDPHMEDRLERTKNLGCDISVSMRNYVADLYGLDLNIGKVLEVLDELGLSDNTLVIFATDQGPAPNNPSKMNNKNDPQLLANMLGWGRGFRGGKHTFYEGGVRIPFILRWPGNTPAGKTNTDSRLSALDFLPTLCSIAGVDEVPDDIEGKDVTDIWKGSDHSLERPLFWKLSDSSKNPAFKPSVLSGKWKYYSGIKIEKGVFLYNIEKDPGELKDVAKQNPEVVEEMQRLVDTWNATLPSEYTKDKELSADRTRSVFK